MPLTTRPLSSLVVRAALALSLCPAVALGQPAPAAPTPAATTEARERYQRGVELFDERNYTAAMVEFQRAYELTRNPAVLFNISATHELSGHFVEALDAMHTYERDAPAETVTRRRAEVDAALARLRQRVGTVIIRFEAPGLELRIDGLVRATTEARTGLRVGAGRHRVSLSAPHFQPREEEFDIAGGTTVTLSEPLVPEAAYMAVDCNVPGAEIVVDGRVVGTTPTTSPLPVPEGTHHVTVRRPGFTPYETDVNSVGAGARVRAQLAWLDPIPTELGARVVVAANESNLVVMVGGRRINNDGRDLVPPGPHRLRIERDDFLPEERDVTLPAAQLTTVTVSLAPTPAYRAAWAGSVRRSRITGGVVLGVGVAIAAGGAGWFFLSTGPAYSDSVTTFDNAVASLNMCGSSCTDRLARETAANDARVDRDNADIMRWVSVGVMGLGAATAVVGTILLATGPSSSRFERAVASLVNPRSRLALQGGFGHVGLTLRY